MLIVSVVVTQLIIFVGMIYFFRRIITRNVASATQHIDDLNQEYDRKDKEVSKRLEDAKKEAQALVSRAISEAQLKKEEIIKRIESEREGIIKQARTQSDNIIKQADKSREQLLAELDRRIAKEAINKACELIQDTLPENFKFVIHKQWIEDLLANGFSPLKDLNIQAGIKEVKVSSAFSLSAEQKKEFARKLKALLGREIIVKEDVDPRIVAGAVVTVGSLVLDGGLKNKIEKEARDTGAAEEEE